jgi:N-acylneuraminate cytidylyltransferase
MSAPRGSLAVIPARGGSKRLPRKNLLPLGGLPMVAHTIRAATRSGCFARVVVSTDDPELAAVAREHGAEVPFMRDARLADDHTPVSAVAVDALRRLASQSERYELVSLLLPNCPLRDAEDVRASYAAFLAQPFAAQVSVCRYGWLNPWWALRRGEDGAAAPLFPEALKRRSQDLPPLFCPTGAVWWSRADALIEHGTFHQEPRALFELPWDHAVDIDDEADLRLAEALLAMRGRA